MCIRWSVTFQWESATAGQWWSDEIIKTHTLTVTPKENFPAVRLPSKITCYVLLEAKSYSYITVGVTKCVETRCVLHLPARYFQSWVDTGHQTRKAPSSRRCSLLINSEINKQVSNYPWNYERMKLNTAIFSLLSATTLAGVGADSKYTCFWLLSPIALA